MPILFFKLHHTGERGRKGRECKFPKITHRTFDPINSWPPVVILTSEWEFNKFSNSTIGRQFHKCLLNNTILNNYQMTNWTSYNCAYAFLKKLDCLKSCSIVKLFTMVPNHNGSKQQLIQTTINPSHRVRVLYWSKAWVMISSSIVVLSGPHRISSLVVSPKPAAAHAGMQTDGSSKKQLLKRQFSFLPPLLASYFICRRGNRRKKNLATLRCIKNEVL